MEFRIEEIADIIQGINTFGSILGDGVLITPSFFTKGYYPEALQRVELGSKAKRHVLKQGDVLLVAKGREHQAFDYGPTSSPAIPSAAFTVIRVSQKNLVLPQYLTWYLNQAHIQKQLTTLAKGSSLPALALADVADFTVEIPEPDTQKLIVRLATLHQKRQSLTTAIQSLETLLFQHQLHLLSQS